MTTRVFARYEDERISISGWEWPLKALPSGKAVNLSEMAGDLSKVYEKLTDGIDENTDNVETLSIIGRRVYDARYKLFSFGLQVDEESKDYEELKQALDKASFPELFWALDQILEVNGVKQVEKLIKNLFSRLEPMLPDLQDATSALLKRFSRNEELTEQLKNIRSIGSTQSSDPLEENRTFSNPEVLLKT